MELQCRICLEVEQSEDKLLKPCLCKGTSTWIHPHCLYELRKTWRACPTCMYTFPTRPNGMCYTTSVSGFYIGIKMLALVISSAVLVIENAVLMDPVIDALEKHVDWKTHVFNSILFTVAGIVYVMVVTWMTIYLTTRFFQRTAEWADRRAYRALMEPFDDSSIV